jgi:hypothetical protein
MRQIFRSLRLKSGHHKSASQTNRWPCRNIIEANLAT